MIQYTLTEVASIMGMTTATLVAEATYAEETNDTMLSMVTEKVMPIGTVNINNKQYFFGYSCEDYCKNDDKMLSNIMLGKQCVTTKFVVNDSPKEQQVIMAMHIDNDYVKRHNIDIIW